jgi:hypothetical protein
VSQPSFGKFIFEDQFRRYGAPEPIGCSVTIEFVDVLLTMEMGG